MSTPLPLTVNTPLSYEADPARAGLPTSVSVHGDGRVPWASGDCAPTPQSATTSPAVPRTARYLRKISPRCPMLPSCRRADLPGGLHGGWSAPGFHLVSLFHPYLGVRPDTG